MLHTFIGIARAASERRAGDLRARRTGCETSWQAREAFFRRHFGCPLDGIAEWTDTYRPDYGTFPFMKATHYMAKVVNLLNQRRQSRSGATRDATRCNRRGWMLER